MLFIHGHADLASEHNVLCDQLHTNQINDTGLWDIKMYIYKKALEFHSFDRQTNKMDV